MNKQELIQEILDTMQCISTEGHTMCSLEYIYSVMNHKETVVGMEEVESALAELCANGCITQESNYFAHNAVYNLSADLAVTLANFIFHKTSYPTISYDITATRGLSTSQSRALLSVCQNRISLVTGHPASGKTTIAVTMARAFSSTGNKVILTAPTDSGVATLASYHQAATRSFSEIFQYNLLDDVDMIVVDEAEFLTEEEALRLFNAIPATCHLVLLGCQTSFYNRGAGDVFFDMVCLGFHNTVLNIPLRQSNLIGALNRNVLDFDAVKDADDFSYDTTFVLKEPTAEASAVDMACDDCQYNFHHGVSSQVITENQENADQINANIQKFVTATNKAIDDVFHHGDRIIALATDEAKGIYAGALGKIHASSPDLPVVVCQFGEDHFAAFCDVEWNPINYRLAYATSAPLAKGREYAHVYLVLDENNPFQTRHWLRAVCSMASTSVTIYGTKATLTAILKTEPMAPMTNLAYKTSQELVRLESDEQYKAFLAANPHAADLGPNDPF